MSYSWILKYFTYSDIALNMFYSNLLQDTK